MKPFVDTYNQEGINNLSGVFDWKRPEKNNQAISLNLYNKNEKRKDSAYVSKKIQSVQNCFKMVKNMITSQ